jgi:nitrogenase molybdenum-iron protein NifN
MIEVLVETPKNASRRDASRVNVLPGCHLTPGDLDELRTIIEDFGLEPTFLPDLGGSLDGHIPEDFTPTTIGGVGVDEIATMGNAGWTIAIGAQMRRAAEALQKRTNVPFKLFERLCGLDANDELMSFLSTISGRPAPMKYRRQRGQLVDAMLDGHFHIGGRKVAIGAEPDLLYDISGLLTDMGARIFAAVSTTLSPVLERVETDDVLIGDLEDLENLAKDKACDLLITHSHGRQAAGRLKIPFFRIGIPMFDRLGGAHQTLVGYRGARDLIFDLCNLLMADQEENHEPTPETWRDGLGESRAAAH